MFELTRWQKILIERAVAAELATMEVEEARVIGDSARIIAADRYLFEAKRLSRAAQRRVADLSQVAA